MAAVVMVLGLYTSGCAATHDPRSDGQTSVVRPTDKPGYTVYDLPADAVATWYDGGFYYRCGTTFLKPTGRSYVVIDDPM